MLHIDDWPQRKSHKVVGWSSKLCCIWLLFTAKMIGGPITSGAITLIPAPASVQAGATASSTQIFLFFERVVTLPSSLTVNVLADGTYNSDPGTATLPAGVYLSWMLHANDLSPVHRMDGSVTFDNDVVALIGKLAELNNSDSIAGNPGTLYPSASRSTDFGSVPAANDIVTLLGSTVSVSFGLNGGSDELRILTAVPEPSTTGAMLVALILFARIGRIRRRE